MDKSNIDKEYLARIGMSGDYKQVSLDCEICGRNDFEPILEKGKIGRAGEYGPINIVQCRHCGHVMMNPRLERQFYVDYYRSFYKHNVAAWSGTSPKAYTVERQRVRGDKCCKYLAEKHGLASGAMLDLGCGYGSTMLPFRDKGWAVTGIDPEEEAVQYANEKLGLSVDYGFAEELPYDDNSFDLVISLGALEHVHDFNASMSELTRTIKPGGYLFIRMRHNRPWGVIWEYYNRNHYRFFCGATHKLAVMRYGFELAEYTDTEIEGRKGDRYLLCKLTGEPSDARIEEAIAGGLKDTPEKLRGYLRRHHVEMVKRARKLLDFEEKCGGDAQKIADGIMTGRFKYTLMLAYFEPKVAVERALLEARCVVSENDDDGIVSG